MRRKDLLKTIIKDNQSRKLPEIWTRSKEIPLKSGKIITLSGVRRSGKTYHMFNLIKKLKQEGIDKSKILYVNFEDERLNLNKDELDLLLKSYRELYPKVNLEECFFFFDEIQEVEGWEKFIIRLYNTVTKNIFVTGSNATLLSKEIATSLRGRTITFEIYPLSFKEFVNISGEKIDFKLSSSKAKLVFLFEKFLTQGGFPELVKMDSDLKQKVLQEYFDVMVLRDMIERYSITQPSVLKYFSKRVIGSSAGEFSSYKIYNELKSQGYKISKDTVYKFQDYVESVYLALFISKYDYSVVKREMSKKKVYTIDTGLGSALDFKFSKDKGRLLETTVALDLIKQGKNISFIQNDFECDFVISEKNEIKNVIQVTYDMSEEKTRKREIKGLIKACKKFDLNSGFIVSFDEEEEFVQEGISIKVIPAWKFLLS